MSLQVLGRDLRARMGWPILRYNKRTLTYSPTYLELINLCFFGIGEPRDNLVPEDRRSVCTCNAYERT